MKGIKDASTVTDAKGIRARGKQIEKLRDRLVKLAEDAAAGESFTPAVTALSRVATLEAEIRRCETAAVVSETLDPMRQVEVMRAQALEDGSMAAAATLTDQLRAMKAEQEAKRQAAEEEARIAADPNAQFSALVEALRGMPPDQVTRLRDELGWHR